MSTFEYLQRKSSTGSTPATPTSQWPRSSRPLASAPVSTPEQVSPHQQTQPTDSPGLKYSLADLPIFPSKRENRTGLPDNLKAGIENLSGLSMNDVRVHSPSSKPAQLQALAYTQGTDIYVGPGQERYLPHEAWHVVQQKLGRVKPIWQAKGVRINDDQSLEREADVMGTSAAQNKVMSGFIGGSISTVTTEKVVQGVFRPSPAFKKSQYTSGALTGITSVLQSDEDFAWAMESEDVIVELDLSETEEGAEGSTELLLGKTNLEKWALYKPDELLQRLQSPQQLTVRIILDEKSLIKAMERGQGSAQAHAFVTLAHEVGAHLKPKLSFIRKVTTQGGITQKDMNLMLRGSAEEHHALFHATPKDMSLKKMRKLKDLPKNETYFKLVLAFANLVKQHELHDLAEAALQLYVADISRYDPNKKEADKDSHERADDLMDYMAMARLQQEQNKKIVVVGSILVIIAAILVGIYKYM